MSLGDRIGRPGLIGGGLDRRGDRRATLSSWHPGSSVRELVVTEVRGKLEVGREHRRAVRRRLGACDSAGSAGSRAFVQHLLYPGGRAFFVCEAAT